MYFIGVKFACFGKQLAKGRRVGEKRLQCYYRLDYGVNGPHLSFSKLAIPTAANDTAHSPGSKHIFGSCSGSGKTDVIHPTGSALVCLGKPEFERWEQEDPLARLFTYSSMY